MTPSPKVFIHLTDSCNQNCSFCFAREEMINVKKKQISFQAFKKIAIRLKKMNVSGIAFIGGEPTLHPQFNEIVKYTLKHFFYVRLYTNGIFSEAVKNCLNEAKRVHLIINISTPGFQLNQKIRGLVLDNIKSLYFKLPITLSVVSLFMNDSVIEHFKHVPKYILKKNKVKFCFMVPVVNDRNLISINDFSKVGKNLCRVIRKLEEIGPPRQIRFNPMFRPCMFDQKTRVFFKRRNLHSLITNSSCHNNDNFVHITSEFTTFKCYPLSTIDVYNLNNVPLENLHKKYLSLQKRYQFKLILPNCRKCPFFGFGERQCTGPCIAFRINALSRNKKNN